MKKTYAIGVFMLLAGMACATQRFVKWDAAGANNGTSWTDAYTNLADAIAQMGVGDTQWVARGTYYPGTNRTSAFTPFTNTVVCGGFAGTESLLSQRTIAANETILSGNIGDNSTSTDNCFHVVKTLGNGCVLDGLTIRDGYADSATPADQNGGGLLAGGSLTVVNCLLTNNYAKALGGGIYSYSYGPNVLTNSMLTGNRCNGGDYLSGGGGLYVYFNFNGTMLVSNCQFVGNSATNGAGGGLCEYPNGSSMLTVSGCVISNNVASDGGGFDCNGQCLCSNTVIALNQATSQGGGVYNFNNSGAQFNNCDLLGNSAPSGGAMMNGNPVLINCRFRRNWATTIGGAICSSQYGNGALNNVTGCEFTGNYTTGSGNGGAIAGQDDPLLFTSCTFSNNVTGGNGGAVYRIKVGATTLGAVFLGCTFSGNIATNGGGAVYSGNVLAPTNLVFTNCIFMFNAAAGASKHGGAVMATKGNQRYDNCTFYTNRATGNGGAIYQDAGSTGTIHNSILWHDVAASGGAILFR